MRVSILQGSPVGQNVFEEVFDINTNDFGLVNFIYRTRR